jgi:small ligand-binding sensory domain FIST
MQNHFAVSSHWQGPFEESGLQEWATKLRTELAAPVVTLGLVFMSPQFFKDAAAILEVLRLNARIPLLLGCSSQSLISGGQELEETEGIVLGLYHLPEAELTAFRFTQTEIEQAAGQNYWQQATRLRSAQVNGWIVFADPFSIDADKWLQQWNEAYAPKPILGGLASGDFTTQETQLYLNGEVFDEGGVALAVRGNVSLASVISQGCTPIGETWTITKVDKNYIHEIGNRNAYEVLVETINTLSFEEQVKARGNLFVGLVVNEYLEEFHRGDFIIRNILGVDPRTGSLVVGAFPRPGQTLQFQRRAPTAANEDMNFLLERTVRQLNGKTIYGACLCSCNGRGKSMFGYPNHDANLVQRHLGPLGLTGFFCNGEIGPVGNKNFLHGYTASLALFTEK